MKTSRITACLMSLIMCFTMVSSVSTGAVEDSAYANTFTETDIAGI